MARIDNLENFLTDVANAIRTKKEYESSQTIAAEEFDEEITTIKGENIDTELATQQQIIQDMQRELMDKANPLTGAYFDIYLQTEEPEKKEGIWFRTDDYSLDDISQFINTSEYVVGSEEWSTFSGANIHTYNRIPAVAVKQYMYVIGCDSVYQQKYDNYKKIGKYDTVNDTWEFIPNINQSFIGSSACYCAADGLIHIFGGTYAKRRHDTFNPNTNEYVTGIDSPPKNIYNGNLGCCVKDKNIYLLAESSSSSSDSSDILCYNIDTKTYTTVESYSQKTNLCIVGNKLYSFGRAYNGNYYKNAWCFNLDTMTAETIAELPSGRIGSGLVPLGNYIYIIGGYNAYTSCIKYDIVTNTYTTLPDIPVSVSDISGVLINDNKIYIWRANNPSEGNPVKYLNLETPEFPDKSLVLCTEPKAHTFRVTLPSYFPNPIRTWCDFYNIWIYSETLHDFDHSIPIYYGDGEEWVQIN